MPWSAKGPSAPAPRLCGYALAMRIARGARRSIVAVATALAIGVAGCGESDAQRGADDARKKAEEAGQDAKQAGQDAKDKAEKRAEEAAREIEK